MASIYVRLPDELKLRIWELAAMPHGVNHFTTDVKGRFLCIRPIKDAKRDASAWRERGNVQRTCATSQQALKPYDNGTLLYQDKPTGRRTTHAGENGLKTVVNPTNDLLFIHFEGLKFGVEYRVRPGQFLGITRIAVDYNQITKGKDLGLGPSKWTWYKFGCTCLGRPHGDSYLCGVSLDRLLRGFRDTTTLYFVVKLCRTNIDETELYPDEAPAPRGKKRASNGEVKEEKSSKTEIKRTSNRLAPKVISDTLVRLRQTAQRTNGDVFEDRRSFHVELRSRDKKLLKNHEDLFGKTSQLRNAVSVRRGHLRAKAWSGQPLTKEMHKEMKQQIDMKVKILISVDFKSTGGDPNCA